MKILPLIDVFNPPFEHRPPRPLTEAELDVQRSTNPYFYPRYMRDRIEKVVTDHVEAAVMAVKAGEEMEAHIESRLINDPDYFLWRQSMPATTPESLVIYKKSKYPHYPLTRKLGSRSNPPSDSLPRVVFYRRYIGHKMVDCRFAPNPPYANPKIRVLFDDTRTATLSAQQNQGYRCLRWPNRQLSGYIRGLA